MSIGHWLSNAIATAGKVAGQASNAVHQATGVIAQVESLDPQIANAVRSIVPDSLVASANQLADEGQNIVKASKILATGRAILPAGADPSGYDLGIKLMSRPVSGDQITRVRGSLTPAQRMAFDVAVSMHIGQAAYTPPPGTPAAQAGYLIAKGLSGGTDQQKTVIAQALADHPEARVGAAHAIKDTAVQREGIFARFWHWLGFA